MTIKSGDTFLFSLVKLYANHKSAVFIPKAVHANSTIAVIAIIIIANSAIILLIAEL